MNDLLGLAIEAHGGMEQWQQFKGISAHASITGAIWYVKAADVLKDTDILVETKNEKLTMSFPDGSKKTVFEGNLVMIAREIGSPEIWENPAKSFEGHVLETPWQDVHVAYFSGEALWTYLNIPFLYASPGFVTQEVEPWQENGEHWRRLKIIFPENIVTHSKEQISFFGPDGLMRRHDYAVNVLGGSTGARYCLDYRDVDGIKIPTSHKVYGYHGDHVVDKEPILVAINLSSIHLLK